MTIQQMFLGALAYQPPETPLYSFSSFTFTNAGHTGHTGPSQGQFNTAYSGQAFMASYFSSSGGIQSWTVPSTATYRIKIRGANGAPAGSNSGAEGGEGIIMQFDFPLAKSDVLKMIVGQSGTSGGQHGGGGGASALLKTPYNTNASIIAIAGGGGGRRESASGPGLPSAAWSTFSGAGSSTTTNGTSSISGMTIQNNTVMSGASSGQFSPATVSLGDGGAMATNAYGDGGAGFFDDGTEDGYASTTVARALTGTAEGGYGAVAGGFGGGADGGGSNGGGGGGGYTGGNGGWTAGGGGCYLNSSATSYTESFDGNIMRVGDSTLYHGYIQITKLP